MPATPLGSLPSLNSSLHFLECVSSNTDEDTVFTAESNPSEMNSVNGDTNPVSRMMEGNTVSSLNVESPIPSTATHNPFTSRSHNLPKLIPGCVQIPAVATGSFPIEHSMVHDDGDFPSLDSSGQSLLEANDISPKWPQSRELQGAAYIPHPIIQCHSDTQERRSFSLINLDLTGSDLNTDLSIVIEGNEKSDQANRSTRDGYISS